MNDPTRVMLVDDHVFWRHGLRQIIDAEPDMTVVAEASNGEEAERRALSCKPDVILMDVMMPKVTGLEATRAIAPALPETRIVMLTISDTDENLFEAIKAGALGFLTKDVSPEGLIKAIRDTMVGEATLSPFIAARLVKFIQRGATEPAWKVKHNLTDREAEVLRLIARGNRDREVAEQLFVSESTVKKHVQNVLRKLHARNRVEAVGFLEPENRGP